MARASVWSAWTLVFAVVSVWVVGGPAARAAWTEDDFFEVSSPASPRVAYALEKGDANLRIAIDVQDAGQGSRATVKLGAGAARSVVLDASKSIAERIGDGTRYTFTIPNEAVAGQKADWEKFRLAFAVTWPGGPLGQDLQREHYFQQAGATFDELSANPQDWLPFDLGDHAKEVANRKARIFISFDQPLDGKATVVIEDSAGHRVRNLISGLPFEKGPQKVEWDGLDDKGNVAPPGDYRWRAIAHPGITPHYQFSFCNYGKPPWRSGTPGSDWLADESNPVAATTFEDKVYLGSPQAESGNNIIQTDLSGNESGHVWLPASIVGRGKMFMAADGQYFYAILEGKPAYPTFQDLPDGKWSYRRSLSIMRWDMNMQQKRYDGQLGEKVITDNLYIGSGPKPTGNEINSPTHDVIPNPHNLAGAALLDGKFYISLQKENRIVVVDAGTGNTVGEIKLENPGLVATDGKRFLEAFSGDTLVRIDPATLQTSPLFKVALSPLQGLGNPEEEFYGFVGDNKTGMAIGADGEIFLSDNGVDQNIKVFDQHGTLLREIGEKGGRKFNGPWDPNGVFAPHGLTVDREGKLWVTETAELPRRVSVWDTRTGALIKEYLGPPYYGAPGGAIDSADHTRWLGEGLQWKLDFDKKTATPVSSLFRKTKPGEPFAWMIGMRWHFYHLNGRTFLIGAGLGDVVYELLPNGAAKVWAFCAPLAIIAQNPRWTLPAAMAELPAVKAYLAEDAATAHPPASPEVHPYGTWGDSVWFSPYILTNGKTGFKPSVLWVDRNGDGIMQPDEVEVFPEGNELKTITHGDDNPTLDLALAGVVNGRESIIHVKPDGFLPSGAPNYSLARALATAVPIPQGIMGTEPVSIQDRFGRFILDVNPLTAFTPDGKVDWTFPNNWVGVGGSHVSPLPEPGVMQGVNFFLGSAPLDDKSEVMVLDGNHGRFFVLTTDGFYLDEMFKDVRVTQNADAYLIGGEPFGGCFEKCEDGKYYLQSGHTDYRVFRIDGLDQLHRFGGTLTVSGAQMAAAQANREIKAAQALEPKAVDVVEAAPGKPLPTDSRSWPAGAPIIWGDRNLSYPYAEARVLRQGPMLYLAFNVKDPSPWVNHGSDITQLFKTGDCVDFQFSTDPKARPDRGLAAPGDKRLLIAPHGDGSIAMLYSFREPGGTARPVSFTSPTGTETVDRLTELKSAKISVDKTPVGYIVTVAVPLADLGLPEGGVPMDLKGDFGVIYGDESGTVDVMRSYWSNQATGLVNDLPNELRVIPRLWGTLHFQAAPSQ